MSLAPLISCIDDDLEGAAARVGVNAVVSGPTYTAMLDRFPGTPESRAALRSAVPPGRVGKPDGIASAILFRIRRRFLHDRTDRHGPRQQDRRADEERPS
jgi:NAD(P)-dependent dehydrogenase (short-subunit alcohol dehydrogenase family)